MPGIYDLLSISAEALRPGNWENEAPMTPSQLEQAAAVAKGAEDSIQEFTEGIIGLGGVLTIAGESGEVAEHDVAQVGRLLRTIGETLVGLQFAREEAEHFINESGKRSATGE